MENLCIGKTFTLVVKSDKYAFIVTDVNYFNNRRVKSFLAILKTIYDSYSDSSKIVLKHKRKFIFDQETKSWLPNEWYNSIYKIDWESCEDYIDPKI